MSSTPPSDQTFLSFPKRDELRKKSKYYLSGGDPTSTIVTYSLLLRIIQHYSPPSPSPSPSPAPPSSSSSSPAPPPPAKLTYDEARTQANKLYLAGAMRHCPNSGILIVEDAELKEMVQRYEREVPEHVCAEGKDPVQCVWPDWECGTVFEVRDGVLMYKEEGWEEWRAVNPEYPN
ncbi:hypothetical protein ONS95_003425 [Cadophora gregata]|uniref:uncharacterized protein n=1 Tax=Cadophora gregata TaxID=51156 RepID=UPI0026DB2E92|nr:uncharacterized protein ONS95_003425 [Cadophora gregata]KAK0108632.1 hypothetical protein ONS95_003425 [Cadophora gregata]KAK0108777.1 hypothetical protein ONS96_002622 [Cadophora gregata f. sp. sojae]